VKLVFTEHAVERFVQRIAPDLTLPAARTMLERAETVRLREKTHAGQLLFRSAEPPALFVVKPDGDFVCVTVLPDAPVEAMGEVAEWEMELIREHMAEVAEREAAARAVLEMTKQTAVIPTVAQHHRCYERAKTVSNACSHQTPSVLGGPTTTPHVASPRVAPTPPRRSRTRLHHRASRA
jgi:hypothetical protein